MTSLFYEQSRRAGSRSFFISFTKSSLNTVRVDSSPWSIRVWTSPSVRSSQTHWHWRNGCNKLPLSFCMKPLSSETPSNWRTKACLCVAGFWSRQPACKVTNCKFSLTALPGIGLSQCECRRWMLGVNGLLTSVHYWAPVFCFALDTNSKF